MPERGILLTLAYDGSRYHGWQRQTSDVSIQGTVESVLAQIFKQKITLHGVGRTDAGTHALAYSAHFHTENQSLPVERVNLALNTALPEDIRVLKARTVPLDFHARFSARAREYIYHIIQSDIADPLWRRYAYFEHRILSVEKLREAARLFRGEKNFASFCYGYGGQKINTLRRLDYLRVARRGKHFFFFIKGSGFLQGMIRSIVSVLLSYNFDKLSLSEISGALEGKTKIAARKRVPVPARGLFFKRAFYDFRLI